MRKAHLLIDQVLVPGVRALALANGLVERGPRRIGSVVTHQLPHVIGDVQYSHRSNTPYTVPVK